jgi:hypothetical protein
MHKSCRRLQREQAATDTSVAPTAWLGLWPALGGVWQS